MGWKCDNCNTENDSAEIECRCCGEINKEAQKSKKRHDAISRTWQTIKGIVKKYLIKPGLFLLKFGLVYWCVFIISVALNLDWVGIILITTIILILCYDIIFKR